MNHRLTASLLVTGAVAVNAAFFGLGALFDYPDVLQQPGAEVLASFRDHQVGVMSWFAVLLTGAALMAPIAVGVRRLGSGRVASAAMVVGIAAAVVQVIGLSRWLLVIPTVAWQAADPAREAEAVDAYERVGFVMGEVIGETFGYLLTALWTLLVLRSLAKRSPRWFTALGTGSAVAVLSGVLIPFGVPGTDLANFLGYVGWSVWLIGFAVLVGRGRFSSVARVGHRLVGRARRVSRRRPRTPRLRTLGLGLGLSDSSSRRRRPGASRPTSAAAPTTPSGAKTTQRRWIAGAWQAPSYPTFCLLAVVGE